jgi:hypothetical protein
MYRLRKCRACLRNFAVKNIQHRACSNRCWRRLRREADHRPPRREREVGRLPYRGQLPAGAPVRVCRVHRRPLAEDPVADELWCRVGRHRVDAWGISIAGHVVAEADVEGITAVARCMEVDLADYLADDAGEPAARKPGHQPAA